MPDALSPNCEPRPEGGAVDVLVLHYTGMETAEAALARLRDPEAKVSAHYFVDEDGKITPLVPENLRAWHAGVSFWRGEPNVNDRSIGIEIVNPGHDWGYRDFPLKQVDAVTDLRITSYNVCYTKLLRCRFRRAWARRPW